MGDQVPERLPRWDLGSMVGGLQTTNQLVGCLQTTNQLVGCLQTTNQLVGCQRIILSWDVGFWAHGKLIRPDPYRLALRDELLLRSNSEVDYRGFLRLLIHS